MRPQGRGIRCVEFTEFGPFGHTRVSLDWNWPSGSLQLLGSLIRIGFRPCGLRRAARVVKQRLQLSDITRMCIHHANQAVHGNALDDVAALVLRECIGSATEEFGGLALGEAEIFSNPDNFGGSEQSVCAPAGIGK